MKKLLLLVILVGLLIGCGYTFQGSGSVLPADVKKVYVPLVENNSPEAGLANIVTEALRDQFERFGVLSVVDDYSEADAVLKVRIIEVRRETSTVTSKTDVALEYSTQLVLSGLLRRTDGGTLWQNNNIAVAKNFGTSSDVVVTSSADFSQGSLGAADLGSLNTREVSRSQERETLTYLAEQAAKKIYNDAVLPEF